MSSKKSTYDSVTSGNGSPAVVAKLTIKSVGKPDPSHMIYIVMYVLPVIYRTFTVPVLPEMVRGLGVMAPYVPPSVPSL